MPQITMRVARVLIVDDQTLFRSGLAKLLGEDPRVDVVGQAVDGLDAIAKVAALKPDIVMIDIKMPNLDGVEATRRIGESAPDVRVVVLSASEARKDILTALAAGAHGYIVKSHSTDAMVDHLRYVLSGEIYVPPMLAQLPPTAIEAPLPMRKVPAALALLSERQRQVLKGLVDGRSNKEIAHDLQLSEGTVKMHIAALFRHLGAINRTHAAVLGKQLLD